MIIKPQVWLYGWGHMRAWGIVRCAHTSAARYLYVYVSAYKCRPCWYEEAVHARVGATLIAVRYLDTTCWQLPNLVRGQTDVGAGHGVIRFMYATCTNAKTCR